VTIVARGRALAQADLPLIHALHLATVGAHPPMSAADLAAQLYDVARDRGRRVVVTVDGDAITGCAGWVEAAPWCFGSPVFAVTPAAAEFLVAHVIARARACGATRTRITVYPGEALKRAALVAAGFQPAFDFVTLARARAAGDGARWAGPLRRVAVDAMDVEALRDVNNDTFDGVPNSSPFDAEQIREMLASPALDHAATAAYADADGRYQAFVVIMRDADPSGPFGVVDAIGVRTSQRGRGVAAAILDDVLARVDAPQLRALIASSNAASLALHAARGFTELARRVVTELVLTPA
jgi:predicted GNAT superfamily acetyltransferase